jgi:hypothetical protein
MLSNATVECLSRRRALEVSYYSVAKITEGKSPIGTSRHFATLKFGRYRGMADIDQAALIKLD